ncbi:MAG TPA: hypothetical protein DEA90_06605 [Opitutae bacterium]|nr:hypothetical protein [Opitutae bacterium]
MPVTVPLYASSNYSSGSVNESGELVLYRQSESGKDVSYQLAVSGHIPQRARSVLGIYRIASNGQAQIHFYGDDWTQFPSQSYRLINISPVVINSKVGDDVLQLQPFESQVVQVKLSARLPTVKIITVYKDSNEEWKPIYNKRTALLPNKRVTGLAVVTQGALAAAMGMAPAADSQGAGGMAEDSAQMAPSLRYFSINDNFSSGQDRSVPTAPIHGSSR